MLAVGGPLVGEAARSQVRLASGLGGGVGGTQREMCGALSGGLLVLGALYGRDDAREGEARAYRLADLFRARFVSEFGDTQCARLRATVVHGAGGLGSCGALVERAARILVHFVDEVGTE